MRKGPELLIGASITYSLIKRLIFGIFFLFFALVVVVAGHDAMD